MSRIKSVYPSAEVFHLWANRAVSHDIRNASGSVSTRNMGAVLVSYGSHFAMGGYFTRADGESILLMNDDRRSVTSSKHRGYAWRALPQSERDRINAAVMKDPRLAGMNAKTMPFDAMRMFWGGFKPMVSL